MDVTATVGLRTVIAPPSLTAGRAPDKLEEAARQFEALLVAQILKSAMPSESSFLGEQEDQAGDHAVQFAMEELGRAIAAGGGLGLARLVVNGLRVSTRMAEPDCCEPGPKP